MRFPIPAMELRLSSGNDLFMATPHSPPPILTVTEELLGWSLDRTAGFPKSHRFTFGQRIDGLMLTAIERIIISRYQPELRIQELKALNLDLEILRVLWRIVHSRKWISQSQLLFVSLRIDEVGRMAGAWLKATKR